MEKITFTEVEIDLVNRVFDQFKMTAREYPIFISAVEKLNNLVNATVNSETTVDSAE